MVAGAGGEVRGLVGRGWWARFEGSDGAYRALLAAAEVDCRSCGRSADVVAAITLGEDELQLQDLERLVGKAEPGELVLSNAVAKLLTATLTRAGIEIEDRRGTRSGSGSGAVLAPPWSRIVRQAAALVALEPSEESSVSRLPDFLAGSSITARYLLVGLPTAKGLWVQCVARDLVEPSTVVLGWLKTPVWSDSVEDERLGRALERSRWLRHPNIAQLVNVLRVGGDLFTVSEWVSGPTLRQVLDTVGPMSQATALELARTLCSALSAASESGSATHSVSALSSACRPTRSRTCNSV